MAGDWIKLESATVLKPEVLMAAELLGISRREAVGLFIDYFLWLDDNLGESCPGLVPNVSRKCLEEVVRCPGFASVLERIGWASFDDESRTMCVINWDRHNGKTAKTRALEQKKKALQRKKLSRSCPDNVPINRDQRREEKSIKSKTALESVRTVVEEPVDKSKAVFKEIQDYKSWATTSAGKLNEPGIKGKAAELGLVPNAGETWLELRDRCILRIRGALAGG